MTRTWLIRFSSDLTTKFRGTRRRFQQRLARNLEEALKTHDVSYTLNLAWSRLFLEADDDRVPDILQRIFGVHSYSHAHTYPLTTLQDVVSQGQALFEERVRDKTYAVRARRAGGAPFSAMDVQIELGAALNAQATVDLSHPQLTVYVEVRDGQVYFFSEHCPGPGGLPLGVEGKALALMSGGFDSAVAAWMMLKRGLALDYVFFRLGGEEHLRDVHQVIRVLSERWSYGTRPRLYVVPFEAVVRQIQDGVKMRYWQLVLKRQMYRVAQAVAQRRRTNTLITGEALGQVSSQTLSNLEALNVTGHTLLLRPLIGFDKQDIISKAYAIGTGELSAHVPEHCAIVPQRPATSSTREQLDEQERGLDIELDTLMRSVRRVDLRDDDPLSASHYKAVSTLPPDPNAVLLDLRTEAEFRREHDPRALHFEFVYALDFFHTLDKGKTYYVYCNVGLKSANLVERMKQSGYRAAVYQPSKEERPDTV